MNNALILAKIKYLKISRILRIFIIKEKTKTKQNENWQKSNIVKKSSEENKKIREQS